MVSQFGGAHIGLANLLDERSSEPYGCPQLPAVELIDEHLSQEGIVERIRGDAAAEI